MPFVKPLSETQRGQVAGSTKSAAAYLRKLCGSSKRKWREWHMRNNRLLPYETIVQAASGEPEAVETVLQYYRRLQLNNRRSWQNPLHFFTSLSHISKNTGLQIHPKPLQ